MKLSLNDDACRCLVFVVACLGVLVPMVLLVKDQPTKALSGNTEIKHEGQNDTTCLRNREELISRSRNVKPIEASILKSSMQTPNVWVWGFPHVGLCATPALASDSLHSDEILVWWVQHGKERYLMYSKEIKGKDF